MGSASAGWSTSEPGDRRRRRVPGVRRPGHPRRHRPAGGGGRVPVAGDGRHQVGRGVPRRRGPPLSPGQVFGGYLTWVRSASLVNAALFVAVAAALGGVTSPWGVLACPSAGWAGLAFAAPLTAYSAGATATSRSRSSCASPSCPCSCSRARSSRSTSFPTGSSRWPGSHRCGTPSSCAGAPHRDPLSLAGAVATSAFLLAVVAAGLLVGRRHLPTEAGGVSGRRTPSPAPAGTPRCGSSSATADVPAGLAGVPQRVRRAVPLPVLDRHRGRGPRRQGPGPPGPIEYEQFVAPGMMAVAAMNGCVFDTTRSASSSSTSTPRPTTGCWPRPSASTTSCGVS